MASQPSIDIPKAPDPVTSYEQGINTYLPSINRFIGKEERMRAQHDPVAIAHQQQLQAQFGPTQYAQQLEALQALAGPSYDVYSALGSTLADNLAGNFSEGDIQSVRRAEAARGNIFGQAAVTGESNKLMSNAIGQALQYQNSANPISWIQGIAPVQPDRSSAYVNPDVPFQFMNADQANFQNQLGIAALQAGNQGSNPWSSVLGAVGGITGAIGGSYIGIGPQAGAALGSSTGQQIGGAFSDRRIKENIKPVGKLSGHKIYEHAYKNHPGRYLSAMAQDVQRTDPDAVGRDPASGLLKIDYRKLGLPLPIKVG